MFTTLPAGRMADRFGGMKLIAAGIGVQIVGIGGAAFSDQFGWLLASAFLLGLGQIGCAIGLQSFAAVKAGPGHGLGFGCRGAAGAPRVSNRTHYVGGE